jgi:hypothetical protein
MTEALWGIPIEIVGDVIIISLGIIIFMVILGGSVD